MVKTAATKTETKSPETVGQMIEISLLEPSPTNPRKRFYDNTLEELAASIKEQGVIEPLIVRALRPEHPDHTMFEIVCGERRYRAAKLAETAKVPCIVRELTDDQVLDIQIHENLHREDVHPMDEAYGYKFLKDKLSCTNEELALRVGKSERFVAERLKLNNLIEEAQADIEAGHLPLTYAREIAKYPVDIQKPILNEGTYNLNGRWDGKRQEHVYTPIKDKIKPWAEFVSFIQTHVLHLLSAAPFDTKATNLRADGLACIACPDRTGANASLFDAEQVDKKDACLNPLCFRGKAEQFVTITRERIAHEASIEASEVPLIDLDSYGGSRDGTFGRSELTIIGKKPFKDCWSAVSANKCEKSVTAVNIGKGQYGKTYTVCLPASGCETHYNQRTPRSSGATSSGTSDKQREAEMVKKRERREEIVDCHVSDAVRKRVFRLAADKFAGQFELKDEGPDTFIAELLTKLWFTSNNDIDSNTRGQVVQTIMRDIMDDPKALSDTWRSYGQCDVHL